MLIHSVKKNASISVLNQFVKNKLLDLKKETETVLQWVDKLKVKAPSISTAINLLSGGNQQKVVFGKWLLANARILILNEPTKGVDVGSKVHLFDLMTRAAKEGAGIILMTAEAEEAVEMGDTIIVMRNGRIAGRYERKDVLEKRVTLDEVLRVATTQERESVGST